MPDHNFQEIKRIVNYRPYKRFSNEAYRESLLHDLSKEIFVNTDDGLQRFCDINILYRHALCGRKHAQSYQIPFITKDLTKVIMERSRLRNNFFKNRTGKNQTLYTEQRNYCVSLLVKI